MLGSLFDMDISKLVRDSAVPDSILKIAKQTMADQQHWFEAMKPALELQNKYNEVFKNINASALIASQMDGFSQTAREMAEQVRRMEQFTQPLSQLRESLLFTNQLSKAMESAAHTASWHEKMRELMSPLSMISSSLRMSDEFSKQMADIASIPSASVAEFAKPYQSLLETLNSNSIYEQSIKEIIKQNDWMNGLRLPVIDGATAAAVAAMWGHDGVEKQFQSFGIDYPQFLKDIEPGGESTQRIQQFKIPHIDFWTGFSILLAILMFIYQTRDSAQTEDRLVSEIKLSRDEASKSAALLGQLLQALIEEHQTFDEGQTKFVVRTRVATIRKEPEHGAAVIAEVFPNQVVTMLDEDGKWIKVEYFDWINQENRSGWVLKKYLVRVPNSPQHKQ